MKTLKTVLAAFSFCLSLTLLGCGGGSDGAHQDDPTPPGEATPSISEDPNEVANQMGADYAKEQSKK